MQDEVKPRTFLVLTSDHGPGAFRQEGELEINVKEANTRVPFLVYCPWRINEFSQNQTFVEANIDIMPSLLDAAGLTVPAQAQGRSIFLGENMRKGYAVSESIYGDKYELVQRGISYKNYIRLPRNRERDRLVIRGDLRDSLQTVCKIPGAQDEATIAADALIEKFLKSQG